MPLTVDRAAVLAFRFRRHDLHHPATPGRGPADLALLDLGIQDTGTDGSAWALRIRGVDPGGHPDVAVAWTIRGAPHAYRRADLAAVAVATAPYSERDAAKRVFDAARPLKAAGIPVLDALRVVAEHLRAIVRSPTVKGDVSGRLTERLDPPYLRACRPCGATHIYEQPFRLAALQAGLELRPGTSPPILQRVKGLRPAAFGHLAGEADPRFDIVRNYLRFFGPATVAEAAAYLDAPVAEVKARWPADVVEVRVAGGGDAPAFALAGDAEELARAAGSGKAARAAGSGKAARAAGSGQVARAAGHETVAGVVRLLGSHDPYLQARDRALLVPDGARRKALWPTLGRPGAVVVGGEIAGTWRPRAAGRSLGVQVEWWDRATPEMRSAVHAEAERLAAHRGVALGAVTEI